jgi:hypothetical protein
MCDSVCVGVCVGVRADHSGPLPGLAPGPASTRPAGVTMLLVSASQIAASGSSLESESHCHYGGGLSTEESPSDLWSQHVSREQKINHVMMKF